MPLASRSNASAFSNRDFVCTTHQSPCSAETFSTSGGHIGGLSSSFNINYPINKPGRTPSPSVHRRFFAVPKNKIKIASEPNQSNHLSSRGALEESMLVRSSGACASRNWPANRRAGLPKHLRHGSENPLQGLSTRNTLTPFRQSPHQVPGVR